MANTPPSDAFQVISIRARGETLQTIRARAEVDGSSLSAAALAVIERGPSSTLVELSNVPDKWLVEELIRRFDTTVGSDDYNAAVARADAEAARADAAERRLAAVTAALGGTL